MPSVGMYLAVAPPPPLFKVDGGGDRVKGVCAPLWFSSAYLFCLLAFPLVNNAFHSGTIFELC